MFVDWAEGSRVRTSGLCYLHLLRNGFSVLSAQGVPLAYSEGLILRSPMDVLSVEMFAHVIPVSTVSSL